MRFSPSVGARVAAIVVCVGRTEAVAQPAIPSGHPAVAGPSAAAPLLSTRPTLPAGTVVEPAGMSGLPLQVGDLPPGTVVVRVIRRTFAENIVGQIVELRIESTAQTRTSVTDPEGRAMFSGLSPGDAVRARVVVGTETLESQVFQLPTQGGVRTVLVAGGEEAYPGISVPEAQAQADAGSPSVPGTPQATAQSTVFAFRNTAILVLLAFAAVMLWFSRRSVRPPPQPLHIPAGAGAREDRPSDRGPAADTFQTQSREELFETLVRLEQEYLDGRSRGDRYLVRRAALVEALVHRDARRSA